MSKIFRLLFITLVIVTIGGVGYLAITDVPAPTKDIEKKLSNDQFFAQ